MDVIKKYKIILGSQSPRRKELLSGLDIPFEIRVPDVDESFSDAMPTNEIAEFIALQKWNILMKEAKKDELVICCDTIVVLGNEILGKPKDKQEGKEMLRKLSGKRHTVISGVVMGTLSEKISFSDETQVYFTALGEDELDYYLENYRPFDKAGSYGVQEWIGMIAIEKMEGSFYNVMGLPIHKVYTALKNWK